MLKKEFELNREYTYDSGNEVIAEKNFVVSEDYLISIFDELFPGFKKESEKKGLSSYSEGEITFFPYMEHFLDIYEPETDGEKIYQKAKQDCRLIKEFDTIY